MSPRQVSGEGKNRIESAVHDQATNGILSPSRDRDDLATPYTASRIESNVATPTGKKASHSSSGKPNAEKSHTTANRRFRLVSLSPDDDENGNDVSTARSGKDVHFPRLTTLTKSGVAVPNRRAPESNRSRSRIDDLDGFIISDTEDDPEDIYDGPLVKKPNRRVSLRGAVHDKLDLDIDMVDWQDSNKSSTSKRSNCRRTTSRTPRSIKKPRSRLQEEIDDLDIEMVGWSDKAKSSTSKNTPTKLRSADRTSTKASRSTRASSSLNDDDLFANDHTSDNDSSNKNSRYLMSGALPNERARSAHNVQYVTEFTPDYDPELDSERHIPVPTIEPLISPS
jgi:hypothetical protein